MNIKMIRTGRLQLSPEVKGLLDNGMGFLQKAQDEFSDSPINSIVSFWTAVELLLKVPLAHEHWSLICSGKRIVRSKYLSGDFQSISFAEICERLSDVLETPLSKRTLESFNKVRQHRNRVVHFYHDAFTEGAKQKLLAEQADAWFALNRLMREDWKPIFEGALGSYLASQETTLLIKNSYYADIRFEHVKRLLDKHIEDGGDINECYLCKKLAAPVNIAFNIENFVIKTSTCLVCSSIQDRVAEFPCPECSDKQSLAAWYDSDFECNTCQYSASRYDLFDTANYSPEEYIFSVNPAGCSECEVENSVCRLGDGYFCTYCFERFEAIGQCEYCGTYSTEISEFSSMNGCAFCSGHPAAWSDND